MIKGCEVGGRRTLVVTIEKMKKGVPTVVEIMGERYVLDSKNISKAKEKKKKNERNHDVKDPINTEFQGKKHVSIKRGKKPKQ